jgi:hypothetical protein
MRSRAQDPDPVDASNRVALCDLRVFVDQSTEAVAAQNANTCHVGERMDSASRRALLQRPVGPVRIVMMDVPVQDLWGANTPSWRLTCDILSQPTFLCRTRAHHY